MLNLCRPLRDARPASSGGAARYRRSRDSRRGLCQRTAGVLAGSAGEGLRPFIYASSAAVMETTSRRSPDLGHDRTRRRTMPRAKLACEQRSAGARRRCRAARQCLRARHGVEQCLERYPSANSGRGDRWSCAIAGRAGLSVDRRRGARRWLRSRFDVPRGIFNFGTGVGISVGDLAQCASRLAGNRTRRSSRRLPVIANFRHLVLDISETDKSWAGNRRVRTLGRARYFLIAAA